jgi:hypothetical protein
MNLEIKNFKKKKILFVDGIFLVASNGYKLFISNDDGVSWKYWTKIKLNRYSIFARFRLLARLLRVEITEFFRSGETYYCVAKKGVYKINIESGLFEKIFHIKKGSRPINLTIDNKNNIYFGEYFSNEKRECVNIYMIAADSAVIDCVYTFQKNIIRHIHGIYYDKYENKLWYVTGDEDHECIIGYTDNAFKNVHNVLYGKQQFRAVKMFFFRDYIIYGTDTPKEQNYLYKINRIDYCVSKIISVEGSIIYGVQIGESCFISTTVEPSAVNNYKKSVLYFSGDGLSWVRVCEYEKDQYSMKYLQFGSIIFPKYNSVSEYLYFYGRALKQIDGQSVVLKISEIEKNV